MPPEWVFWDGACGFCRRWARWAENRDTRRRFRFMAYQEAPSPPMTPALRLRCARALRVLDSEGRELAAGRAVLYVLQGIDAPGPWKTLSRPPLIWPVEWGYRLVAANRGRLGLLAPGSKE